MSLADTAFEVRTLEETLKGVLRDMDTLAHGIKKAYADEIAAQELSAKLKRKLGPLEGQKQDIEERLARTKGLREIQRKATEADMSRMGDLHEEAIAFEAGVNWEKKNGFATFSTAPIPVQRSQNARR